MPTSPMTTTAAPANGPNVNAQLTQTTPTNSAGTRPQLTMSNSSSKGAEGARKQAGSPVDGGQRKPPPQKAWTQGTNPITQRPSNLSTSNGVANSPKPTQNPPVVSAESATPWSHLSDRMRFLEPHLLGRHAHITLKNGEEYSGVLSGTTLDPEPRYVFKMVKRILSVGDGQVNGNGDLADDYVQVQSFEQSDVVDLNVTDVVLDNGQARARNGVSSGFRTDTDISGHMSIRERKLQKWESPSDISEDYALEAKANANGQPVKWDQFSENAKRFGIQSSWNENDYTTSIDRSNPNYAAKAARAEQLAREIEASSAMNDHVQEERGHASIDDQGVDEEDKYSGVRRDFPPLKGGGANKYTPPARRLPTGQATVPGAPVDPAIISAQLARPDSAAAQSVQRGISPSEKRATPEPPKPEGTPKPVESTPSTTQGIQHTAQNPEVTTAPPPQSGTAQAEAPTSAGRPGVTAIPPRRPAPVPVEKQVFDDFKRFAAGEKLRAHENMIRQRQLTSQNKTAKLNDLKKFSQNFKLKSAVPDDLVPILAKDGKKQQEIVEKALRAVSESAAQEKRMASAQSTPGPAEAKAAPRSSAVKPESTHASPIATVDRQQNQHNPQNQRPRPPGQNQYGAATGRDRVGTSQNVNPTPRTGMLSTRLALNHGQHRQGGVPYNGVPQPIPIQDNKMQDLRSIPPTGPSATSSGNQTPTSTFSSRPNPRAHEFRPTAHTFQPGGNLSTHSSPRPVSSPSVRKIQLVSFFGGQRPTTIPLDPIQSFHPIRRMLNEAQDDGNKSRENATSGGIPFAFRTPPTWDYPQSNNDKGYIAMFESSPAAPLIPAPPNMISNGHMGAHHHQLPVHLQGGPPQPQGPTPQHTPRHPNVQPHHPQGGPPHFEGQNMQFTHSAPTVHPSPRGVAQFMYGTQPPTMPFAPAQIQPYGMSPVAPHAGIRQQGGNQFINPPVPGMGGQMMTNQPSNGPYMGMPTNPPQMHMYSPAPGPAYPHYAGQMPVPQGPNGYPSPRPGAPMMHHQGSQQGHQQQHLVYMPQGGPMFAQMQPGAMAQMRPQPYPQPHQQPHYGSPQQHHQFPQQAHRGTPSGSYPQPMMQQHSLPPQGPPPTGPANHGQEGNDEVK